MDKQCSHNWQQEPNALYCQCLKCGEKWNVESLLNLLQGKYDEAIEIMKHRDSSQNVLRNALKEITSQPAEQGQDINTTISKMANIAHNALKAL